MGDKSLLFGESVTLSGSWVVLLTRKNEPQLAAWNFQPCLPTPPLSGKGRTAENGLNDQSCLCDEASVKIPEVQGSGSFPVGEEVEVQGAWHAPLPTHLPYVSPPSDGCLYPLSYPSTINW